MDKLEEQYRCLERTWHRLEDEVKFILDAALRDASIKIHSLFSRTKTLDSIREKAVRKSYDQPLKTLDDLVGIRVVCLLRSDLARIGAIERAGATGWLTEATKAVSKHWQRKNQRKHVPVNCLLYIHFVYGIFWARFATGLRSPLSS